VIKANAEYQGYCLDNFTVYRNLVLPVILKDLLALVLVLAYAVLCHARNCCLGIASNRYCCLMYYYVSAKWLKQTRWTSQMVG
jgi:hypothetical protein